MPIGFQIHKAPARPAPELVEQFRDVVTAHLSDNMSRMCGTVGLRRYNPRGKLVGTALTVRTRLGDNLMIHKALDIARPGDVIVADASSSSLTAVLGDLISTKARHRGIAGFVVDGLVRDLPAIRALGNFPVFARGVTPIGPLHRGPGEINFPVSAGGIVVHPGDLVVGDLNGVVIVPREVADDILARLQARAEAESDYVSAVARGDFSNAWVDETLAQAGVPLEEGLAAGS